MKIVLYYILLGMPTTVHSGAMSIHYNTRAGAKDLTFFAAAAHVLGNSNNT